MADVQRRVVGASKSKYGPALFDVLHATEANKNEPQAERKKSWWRARRSEKLAVKAAEDRAGLDDRVEAPVENATGLLDSARTSVSSLERSADVRGFSMEGDRLTVSISTTWAALAVFGIILLLGAAFVVGDRFGPTGYGRGFLAGKGSSVGGVADEFDAIRKQPPATHLVEGLLQGQPNSQPAGRSLTSQAPSSTKWIRGLAYVVVQEFAAGATEDAVKAKAFLGSEGLATEVVTLPTGTIHLITHQGYNLKDPEQKELAEQLVERVHKLGTKYYDSGGRYRLKGYLKTFKGDTWQ